LCKGEGEISDLLQDAALTADDPAVFLLFAPGSRPDVERLQELAAAAGSEFHVSHVPPRPSDAASAEDPGLVSAGNWAELLANGLAFDLLGLTGGKGAEVPEPVQRFGMDKAYVAIEMEAVCLVPGPHIAAGGRMAPVLRSLAWLASQIARVEHCNGIIWHPAHSLNSVEYFRSQVAKWLEGGAFPSLGLTTILPDPDGGLTSKGLSLFCGQELRIEPELVENRVNATKLAARLIHELAESGPLEGTREIGGLEGEALVIEPSTNRKFVRVRAG
jgi:hypothetical protein